jgi:glutaminase
MVAPSVLRAPLHSRFSISKALTVALAFSFLDGIWKRVGVEPSGTAFNSLVQLEYEKEFQEILLLTLVQ